MKKPKPKKQTKKNNFDAAADLSNMGLEPPIIYREGQSRFISERQEPAGRNRQTTQKALKKGNNENLTRSEKREKQTKKRKKRNKLRKFFIWFCLVIVLLSVGAVLSLTVFFHIESIEISGNKRYSEEEILSHCTVDTGENLFLADTQSAKEMLERNLPYVYNAEIKRKLPSSIDITITEAKVAYAIQNKDKTYIYMDDNFKVLETQAKEKQGILILKAEVSSAVIGTKIEFKNEDTADCLSKLAQVVKDNNFTEITSIYSNNISDNYVVYDNRIKFKLGTCENIENKIYQALAACEQLNDSSPNIKGTISVTGDKSLYFTEE